MKTGRKASVIVVDDFPLFRKAVGGVLADSGDFEVLGITGNPTVALGLSSLHPDIMLIDLDAESFDPLMLLREVKFRQPTTRVVMLMNSAQNSQGLVQAIRFDANGYLLRSVDIPEFLDQMRAVAAGGVAASEKVTSALAEQLRSGSVSDAGKNISQLLTHREIEVLNCIASGLSNREIAEHLSITDGTVKVHVKHLLKKLRFRSRVEAAVWASEHGHKLPPEEMPKREASATEG